MPASLQPLSNTLLDIINRPELPAKLPGEGQRFYIPGARRTQVVGQRACVLTDDGKLMIVGMSDNPRYMWEGPALWGICDFSAGIQRDMQSGVDIRVVGDMAYVAWEYGTADSGWHGGVWVIDLSHDMAPVVRSTFETDGSVLAMDVVGDRAYITDSDGVKIVDVSDPDAPMEIGIIPAVGPAKVKVAGSFAYISSGGQVQIWDISDPSAPARVGSCGTVVYTGGADQITDAEDYITRLSVAGNVAVTMDGKGFMQFIDISDPAAPRVMGTFQNSAYLDAQVQLVGSLAYVVTAGRLDVVDFANPASPVLLGTQLIDSLRQVQVVGERGYLTRADGLFTCNTCNLRPIPPEPVHDGGDYYWYWDEKIPLWREPKEVEFAVDGLNEDLSNLSELLPGYQYLTTLEDGVYIFHTPDGDNGLYDPAKYPACVKWSSPVYFHDRSLHEVFNNEIDIGFDSAGAKDAFIASHEDIIGGGLQAYGNSIVFALRNGGPLDVLRLGDSLHGAPHVEWAVPNVRGGSCDV